ncbi:MAG: zinc dependent phospholipase C family protein [Firmicutes bacterium]|nr:zinc dependent phospholipase C family protein [Bacillota bacterium]
MPNALTHRYIGDKIYDSLDDRTKAIVKRHKKAYVMGCLGADTLMGLVYAKDPEIRNAGEKLHEKTVFAGIENTANYLKEHKNNEKLYAFFLGTLTHYVADSTIHPFVYSYVEEGLKHRNGATASEVCLHLIVETDMDVYIGRTLLNGKRANPFWLFPHGRKLRAVIRKYFLKVNRDIYKLKLSHNQVFYSIFLFKALMFVTQRNNNGRIRYFIVRQLDKLSGANHLLLSALRPRNLDKNYDYLNLSKAEYQASFGDKDSGTVNFSFPELLKIAIIRGNELINKANSHISQGIPLDLRDFELNFNGSMNEEYALAVANGTIEKREHSTLTIYKDLV